MGFYRNIDFTKKSELALNKILIYLEREHSDKLQRDFFKKLDYSFNAIILNPESFPVSNFRKTVRKCVVSKQTTIFYKIRKNDVVVVSVFDTRQNPNKVTKIK